MKKWQQTGKKALSVFMAIMMLMTAWVWVAPTEAEAATAGKYTVKVLIYATNGFDLDGTGTYTINFKSNNGTGTADKITGNLSNDWFQTNSTGAGANKGEYVYTCYNAQINGYPTSINMSGKKALGLASLWGDTSDGSFEFEVYVNDVLVGSKASGNINGLDDSARTFNLTVTPNQTPSPNSITWSSTTKKSVQVPTSGTATVSTEVATVKDQFGVNWYQAPNFAYSTTNTATTTTSSISGITVSTSADAGKVSVTNAAKSWVIGNGGNKRSIYVTAYLGTVKTSSTTQVEIENCKYTFDIVYKNGTQNTSVTKYYHQTFGNTPTALRTGYELIGFYTTDYADSFESSEVPSNETKLTSSTYMDNNATWYAAWQANQYSMTFKYRDNDGQWVTSAPVTEYYGRNIPFPTVTSPVNDGVDYTYTFTGWSPAQTTVQAVDGQVYTAVYDEEVHYADKSDLNSAIAAAEAKLNEQKYIDGGYTEESVGAFLDALQQADEALGMMYFLSQQSALDLITNSLVAATNNLTTKKYIVMFVDKDGTILKDGYHFVEYGERVDVPANPEQEPDADYHYDFVEWNSNLSDGLEACNKVTDNLRYIADFAAIPHTFTETKTDSTCTADGVITYTCDCGYSYTAVNPDDLAHHTWSTDYKELVPATCATKGSEAKYCTVCDAIDESTRREIDELGHAFGAYTEYTPATCFGKGAEIAECSRCGAKDVKEIAQKSHSFGEEVTVDKTCTTDGYTKKVCNLCGFTDMTIDKAEGHALNAPVTVDPTCVSVGYTKTTCANCDYEKTEILPATGNHTFIDNWTKESEASCVAQGVEKRVCTVCQSATEIRFTELAAHTEPSDWTVEVPASCDSEGRQVKNCTVCGKELEAETIGTLGHSYEAYADGTYDPTCTTAGATAQKCSRCGDINTTVINPTGHKWSAGTTTDATCTNGGYITYTCENANCNETKLELIDGSAALMHDFTGTETVVTDATCTTDGEKTVECSRCDVTTNVIIPKLGHSYSAWEKIDATNDKAGSWSHRCSICGKEETLEIPAGGHNLVEDTAAYVAPTCTTKGKQVYKCTAHENCSISVTVDLDYAQHTVAQRETPATCIKEGSVEAYCSVCGKVFSTEATPVVPHTLNNGTEVAPTCTTSGYTLYECTVTGCDFSYKEYDETKPATGHTSWTKTDEKAATCTEDGYIKSECSACKVPKEEILPKTGHSFTENTAKATAATCTSLATKTYECACTSSYVEYYGELAAHNYNTLVKKVPATNDSLGYEEYKCDCGLTKITILEATGTHVFDEKIADECVAPTCTENGTDVYKCSAHDNCGVKSSVLVPRLGHTVEAVYNAPTCKAEGSSDAYCTTCDTVVDSVVIPATGIHNWNEGVETTAPTCEGEGVKTYTCSVCSETKTAAIPAKGHDLSTTVKDATCVADGTVEIACSRCDDTDVEKTIYLTKKNHDWNEGEETTAPTCEEKGEKTYTCSLCGDTRTESIPAKGHTWGNWVVVPSTNDTEGSVSRSCLICGAKETVDIPAGNHSLVVDTDKSSDASCTAEGKLVYKCENHADCGITVTVITAKLQHKSETETVTEADCVTNGKVETRCTECGTLLVETTIPAKGHSYKTTVTPATCTAPGSVVTECTVCHSDEAKTVTAIPVMGHDYAGVETLIKSADCETDGSKTVQCSRCDVTTTVILPKFGHSYSDWVKIDATNDKDGSWSRECSTCGKEETLTIPAGGHNLVETENVSSKCNEKGHITYECNAHENCSVTVTVELDYAQHTILEDNVDATCTDNGHSITYCQECGVKFNNFVIPAKGHSYEGQTTLPATCIGEGLMTYTCSKCNDSYTVSVPMTQHTYEAGEEVKATCTTRGYIPYSCTTSGCTSGYEVLTEEAKGHTYKQTVSSSTCTKGGKVTLECECGDTIEADVPALGHAYALSATTAATCTAAATLTYTCSRCDASYTVSVGDKAEHTFSEWKIIAEATENTLGYKTRSCTKCGKIELEKIDAIGDHKFDEFISETPATCTDPGETVYGCSTHDDCGLTSTVVIPANGHVMEETVAAVVPTCDSDGTTAVFTCKNGCGTVEGGEKIPALGHKYGEGAVTPATCKDEGKIVYTCETCNGTYESVIDINKNAHQYETTVTDATCTKEGSVIAKCKLCGNETLNKTLSKLEHSWKKTGETKADCTNDGLTTYKCACGETRTVPVPKLGHKMKASLPTDATCTTSGYTLYTCENGCDYSYREYNDVAAKGHTWGDWVVDTAATQDTEGLRHRECTVCDGGYEEQTIPAMKHVMEVAESKASTCSEAGYIIYKCKTAHEGVDCGYTLRVDIPVAEHSFTTEVTPATCQQNGSVVSSCACGETITTDLGYGIHDLVAVRESEPDCTNDGKVVVKCKLCQHVSYEIAIPATGHNFEAKVTDATCTDDGKIEYTCLADGCGEKSEEIIPAKGHNYVAGEKVDATCTQSAYIPYECSECDSAYNELVSNPVPHNYVKVETVNADCDTDGKEVYKCSCGASYEKAISHFGHSWGAWTITKNPSATEDGEMTRICSRNPNHTETSAIPSLGGSTYTVTFIVDGKEYAKQTIGYGGAATDPGIPVKPYDESKHYNAYWDVDFSAITSDLTVTAVYNETAHTFGEWTTVRESTCQSKGYQTRACACGYEATRDLELSDHDYTIITEDRMEATCTENGYVVVICSACGKSTKQTVKRLGHSMTYHERVYETCDTDGSLAYYECSVCGKKYADRIGNTELISVVVRKKYHTFVVVEGSAATCTSDGKTDYRHCTTCGLNQPSETIPALGHVDVNNDHICDRCSGTYMEGGQIVCTCNCHKVGFFNELIYKILRFFWKLMGSNKTCACGAIHY